MNEKPILFSAPMAKAILDGRKTQTRRIMKPQHCLLGSEPAALPCSKIPCPYGRIGGRLWVRESFYQCGHWESVPGVKTKTGRMKWRFVPDSPEIRYVAPPELRNGRHSKDPDTIAWHKRLARFMPRKASRLTLEITAIRVERLQDISEADAKAEGVQIPHVNFHQAADSKFKMGDALGLYRDHYRVLWNNINGPESWDASPWVWVLQFKRIEQKA